MVEEEEFRHDLDGVAVPLIPSVLLWTPEDVERVEAFSFTPAEDGTGALDSFGGWYTCGGGIPALYPYRSNRDIIHRRFIASALTLVRNGLEL